MRLLRARSKRETRLFFVTDIHGSERCFMKFINAAKVHDVDVLVLGGDISGKRIAPLVANQTGQYHGSFGAKQVVLESEEDLRRFEKGAADAGLYAYRTTAEEVAELERDADMVERLFRTLARERLERWLTVAEERLKGAKVRLIINCGNDDPFELDEPLTTSAVAMFAEGRLVELDERRWMASCGFANLTPWRCPRDVTEEELASHIETALREWRNGAGQLVLNLHCPPYDSGLDLCPLLKDDLSPVTEGGQPVIGPAGSRAVRDAIERHQPILSLHGHIHESRGACKLGRTLAINPGSEYPEGILRGAIVDFDEKGVKSHVLTSG
jgi:uncharacterized protein